MNVQTSFAAYCSRGVRNPSGEISHQEAKPKIEAAWRAILYFFVALVVLSIILRQNSLCAGY